MEINPADLRRGEKYALMITTIIPRPIAWVSTIDREDVSNLAPFSFFSGVTSDPPTVMLSVGKRKGEPKDTAKNLLDNGEAVIHIPHRPLAEKMVETSADVTPEVDEFDLAGLTKVPADIVKPYRIAEAAIAMEAKVVHHQEVGNGPLSMFLLEVEKFHFRDEFLTEGFIDPMKLAAVGRLGGVKYCATSSTFDLSRPK